MNILNFVIIYLSFYIANEEEPHWRTKELKRMLYRAPEFLRDSSPPAGGSQKGDVYSFGIVLFEIIGRQGPWGNTNLSHLGEYIIITMHPQIYESYERNVCIFFKYKPLRYNIK